MGVSALHRKQQIDPRLHTATPLTPLESVHPHLSLKKNHSLQRGHFVYRKTMGLTVPFVNISLSPLQLVLFSFLSLLVIAIIQASLAVIRYRRNFGNAPLPIVPSHGVVVARDKSSSYARELPDESLRLLLVGDSLACGVGQSVKCTPVMPEVISRELSRATGKAVFWTCHGESGASAGWIIRELERGMYSENKVDLEYGACSSDDVEVDGILSGDKEIMVWRERLESYRRRFDPDELGPYDIVVVLTGTNDLKIMLFPWLIADEDRELRRRLPRGGFIEDLETLIHTLSDRMKRGMRNFSERAGRLATRLRGNTEEFESILDIEATGSEETIMEASETTFSRETLTDEEREPSRANTSRSRTPLFVLPAMPIRSSPTVRPIPLQWLTIPVFDRMEAKKRKLAKANPGECLWVKDPRLHDIISYEEQHGALWEQRSQEEVLLSLRYIRGGDCNGIKEAMKHYYQNTSDSFGDTVNDPTPLFQRRGKPGTKVFCADKIHPNEAGYELWALHIANAIIADMKKRRNDVGGSLLP